MLRRSGTVRCRRSSVVGLTVLILAVAFVFGACSPYPVYTHRGEDPRLASADDDADGDTYARETQSGIEDDAGAADSDLPPSTVDPRVFTRVVEMYVGIPYQEGGRDAGGIDCSNLACALYEDYSGKRLPASTRSLYRLPQAVPESDLQVGDLVFFSFGGGRPTHVGVYMGEGRFVHASESQGVIYSSLDTPYYRDAFRGARRIM